MKKEISPELLLMKKFQTEPCINLIKSPLDDAATTLHKEVKLYVSSESSTDGINKIEK